MMEGIGSAVVDIEIYAETCKGVFIQCVKTVDDLLRGFPLLLGFKGNGSSVFIAAANKQDVLARQPEIAHVDISGNVDARDVAYMQGSVGIG